MGQPGGTEGIHAQGGSKGRQKQTWGAIRKDNLVMFRGIAADCQAGAGGDRGTGNDRLDAIRDDRGETGAATGIAGSGLGTVIGRTLQHTSGGKVHAKIDQGQEQGHKEGNGQGHLQHGSAALVEFLKRMGQDHYRHVPCEEIKETGVPPAHTAAARTQAP